MSTKTKLEKKTKAGIILMLIGLFYPLILSVLYYYYIGVLLALGAWLFIPLIIISLLILLFLSKHKAFMAVALVVTIVVNACSYFFLPAFIEDRLTPVILENYYCNQETVRKVELNGQNPGLGEMRVFYFKDSNTLMFERGICLTTVCNEHPYYCQAK